MPDLEELRKNIRSLDSELITILKERLETAKSIGRIKAEKGLPVKNYDVEKNVLEKTERNAKHAGISPQLAKTIMQEIIEESVALQEKDRRGKADKPLSALLVGGEGHMGRWLADFLESQGNVVETVDKHGDPTYTSLPSQSYDIVFICTPLETVHEVLITVAETYPTSIICDIASLKSHFKDTIKELRDDVKLTSVHPLFGPSVKTLSDRTVLLCSLGNKEADAKIQEIFGSTAVSLTTVAFEEHDAYMAYTLTLPHALNLVFADILKNSEVPLQKQRLFGTTTFEKQLSTSEDVVSENPQLYREIQAENPHRSSIYTKLRNSVRRLESIIKKKKEFEEYMKEMKKYYA